MNENLKKTLEYYRSLRGFDADKVLNKKIELINKFFTEEHLNSAVVGLSGGIDSSTVYALLIRASEQENSPIKKVLGISMPVANCSGASNQIESLKFAQLLKNFNSKAADFKVDFLGSVTEQYLLNCTTEKFEDEQPSDWCVGQLVSLVRTPNLYFNAAFLQQKGFRSIVVGTINRDEGSYIGFFGKASDAMVDLQPIADLHKSEVIELAKLLDIPKEIIERTPQGDVWDAKTDEEMIGCPYWFLELYQLILNYFQNDEQVNIIEWTEDEKSNYNTWKESIEKMRSINLHKYMVGSPARYVDVMPRTMDFW